MTRRTRRQGSRGATMIEMVMVGIPMIFMLICIFEISRAMWVYTTEAYAAKEGVRYAIVHGANCITGTYNPNNCPATVGDIAWIVWQAGVGLDPATTTMTLSPQVGTATTCILSACLAKTDQFPPSTSNNVGNSVRIDISTPFRSALGMFWPGSSPVPFAPVLFGATSKDYIQF